MALSLFRSGLIPRLGGALAFGLAAFGAVYCVREKPQRTGAPSQETTVTSDPGGGPPGTSTTSGSGPLEAETEIIEIESVRAIASWTVRVDGETPHAASSDPHRWSGSTPEPGAVLSIDAQPAPDDSSIFAANCLRIRLHAGDRAVEWIEWVERGELVVVPVDEIRAAAPPPPSGPIPGGNSR